MKKISSLLVIGGDERRNSLCSQLTKHGYEVTDDEVFENENVLFENITNFDAVVLPLPASTDGSHIYTRGKQRYSINRIIDTLSKEQTVFAGKLSSAHRKKFEAAGVRVFDYFLLESVQISNAVPTAQGVLKIVLDNIGYTVLSSSVAVTGFGKTAKAVADVFDSLGACVTVFARSEKDLATARARSLNAEKLRRLSARAGDFDIIVNTVPVLVVDGAVLGMAKKECLVIDIASAPFGTDFSAASRMGIKAIQCPSLPGKVAPVTAGIILADGINSIIRGDGCE